MWPIEYGRSDSMSLLSLGYKRYCGFCLFVLWIILEEAGGHVVRVLIHGEAHGEELRPSASGHVSELGSGSSGPGESLR